jgi:hypothetical protein
MHDIALKPLYKRKQFLSISFFLTVYVLYDLFYNTIPYVWFDLHGLWLKEADPFHQHFRYQGRIPRLMMFDLLKRVWGQK